MINCRNCINWADESLEQIEADETHAEHIFMGCRIYGFRENNTSLPSCPHYIESENLFTICHSCQITVPKVCVSLAECVNCTDTDLFCVDHCIGGKQRKYCTHFVRLSTEGAHLIDQDKAFDLFPILDISGKHKEVADASKTAPDPSPHDTSRDK